MAWNEPGGNSNNQDPWGGRRGGGGGGGDKKGPPDLDEAFRKPIAMFKNCSTKFSTKGHLKTVKVELLILKIPRFC